MPANYVFDNSVLLRAFLPDRDGSDSAKHVLALLLAGDITACEPKNALHEFCGALVKAFRKRDKTADEAVCAIRAFRKLPIRYEESQALIERASRLAFAYAKTWYDMYYFAVAEQAGVAVCTADEKCVAGLPGDFPCEYVLLQDFGA